MTATPQSSARTFGQWWDVPGPQAEVAIDDVRRVGQVAFESAGADAASAAFLVDVFLDKALQGDHSRGVVLLVETVHAVRRGAVDLSAEVHVRSDRAATAVVSGGPRASGDLVCRRAMDVAIEKARELGAAVVTAQAQCRINTPYLHQAIDAGLVGMVMAQSVPTVAPLGGREPMLGNAPVGIGIPAGDRPPFVLDMSLTQSSNKGVATAAAHGLPVPEGILLDRNGMPTTDSGDYLDAEATARTGKICPVGSLVPLGNSHKGYALILAVGLLTTVLGDASPPWELRYDLAERGTPGTVFVAIDPLAFRLPTSAATGDVVDEFLGRVVDSPRRDGVDELLYPGLKSATLKDERRANGRVTIPADDAAAVVALAKELGVELTG